MVTGANDLLPAAIERLAVPGILIGHRHIMAGDEGALLPEEIIASSGHAERTPSLKVSGS
jgi:hypothetical protein